ncbi:hypothetical protein LMG3441_05983 [Achromobacter kerstersii]|uniref:Uncharacterized protein n=1 Tax=Achromobacter kerstersii TaxID=1353890 RepID=A0A6S7AR63_9BURK|nr:hypothetical protein LMG3441_05983 [Achromobacter kerstersii]
MAPCGQNVELTVERHLTTKHQAGDQVVVKKAQTVVMRDQAGFSVGGLCNCRAPWTSAPDGCGTVALAPC